jgi:cysteine desulfurase
MNIPYSKAMGSIRFSLSRLNTEKEIDEVIKRLPEIITQLRQIAGENLSTREMPSKQADRQ